PGPDRRLLCGIREPLAFAGPGRSAVAGPTQCRPAEPARGRGSTAARNRKHRPGSPAQFPSPERIGMLALHFLLNVALLIAGVFVFLRNRPLAVFVEKPRRPDRCPESSHPIREAGSLGSPIDFIAPVGGRAFEVAF